MKDKYWVRRYIGGRAADEIATIKKQQEKAKSEAEWNELEDRLNTCVLRLSIAFNKSGFPIPEGLESVYRSYDEVRPDKKDIDRNNVKKDDYQKKMHYYISNAEEFGVYLKSVLGKPDITVGLEEGGVTESVRFKEIWRLAK